LPRASLFLISAGSVWIRSANELADSHRDNPPFIPFIVFLTHTLARASTRAQIGGNDVAFFPRERFAIFSSLDYLDFLEPRGGVISPRSRFLSFLYL